MRLFRMAGAEATVLNNERGGAPGRDSVGCCVPHRERQEATQAQACDRDEPRPSGEEKTRHRAAFAEPDCHGASDEKCVEPHFEGVIKIRRVAGAQSEAGQLNREYGKYQDASPDAGGEIAHCEQSGGPEQVELLFDRERPRVGDDAFL